MTVIRVYYDPDVSNGPSRFMNVPTPPLASKQDLRAHPVQE
jgi:hypothetical protein